MCLLVKPLLLKFSHGGFDVADGYLVVEEYRRDRLEAALNNRLS